VLAAVSQIPFYFSIVSFQVLVSCTGLCLCGTNCVARRLIKRKLSCIMHICISCFKKRTESKNLDLNLIFV
jgi:hypothetical protein